MWKHVEYGNFFTVLNNAPKKYGVVVRNGKKFIKDYNRELKNGKGMSFFDAFKFRVAQDYEELPMNFHNVFTPDEPQRIS